MSKSRKTTLNERIKIVHDCIINGRDYGKTAIQYQVSYQQVRNWVLKYDEMGEKGLKTVEGNEREVNLPEHPKKKCAINWLNKNDGSSCLKWKMTC